MSEQRVALVDSRPHLWRTRFERLRARIAATVPDAVVEHIGSTAVIGLPAKDVVDVLVGVAEGRVESVVEVLVAAGWDLEGMRAGHAWLSVPRRNERTAVAHVVVLDGAEWRDRLDFRDLLRNSDEARSRYLQTKRTAAVQADGWGEYTAMKAAIVSDLLRRSREGSGDGL